MRRFALILICLTACACGSDPAPLAPSPAKIAGAWSGTIQGSTASGGPFLVAIVMTLTQSGSTVSGTWATDRASGTVAGGTDPTSFSGTFTWNQLTGTGFSCTGTFAVSGTAGGTTVNWTSPGVVSNCTNLWTGITIAAQTR